MSGPQSQMPNFGNAFSLGYHTTFGRYRNHEADQKWARKKTIFTDILTAAFAQFIRLRSVAFTEYHGFARDDESYDICCRRLFGRVFKHQHAGMAAKPTLAVTAFPPCSTS